MTVTIGRPQVRPPRNRRRRVLAVAVVLIAAVACVASGPAAPLGLPHGPGAPPVQPANTGACGGDAPIKADGGAWKCIWSDEFAGPALSDDWTEIPYGLGSTCIYDDPEYVQVSGGMLQLIAKPIPTTNPCRARWGLGYGGGGIETRGSFSHRYGRFEIRAKLPPGAGYWPAFWLLPADDSFSGEIDVMEAYGGRGKTIDSTLHRPAAGPGPQKTCPVTPDYSSDFHNYRLEWTPTEMRFYVDNSVCGSFTGLSDAGTSPPPLSDAFAQPYFVALDLVVQPYWPPDATTHFPGVMQVDWVRVWD